MAIKTRVFINGNQVDSDKLGDIVIDSACIDRIINKINRSIEEEHINCKNNNLPLIIKEAE